MPILFIIPQLSHTRCCLALTSADTKNRLAACCLQVYLMLWRSKWWDEHRRRLMVPLYLDRCITYGDAWAAFARHTTIQLAAGFPERQFSYAVASATSFPLIMGGTCHAVESFKGHLLLHSLITAAFLVGVACLLLVTVPSCSC